MYLFSRPVSIESFWLRLHRSPETFRTSEVAYRIIKVYNGENLVTEQAIALISEEWFLLARKKNQEIIGDRLEIQAGTDLDSLIVQWG